MPAKFGSAIAVAMVLIAGIFNARSASAQDTSATSLADQLRAQYKLAKIVPESNSYKVAEPGTLLVIQKEGIVGVPLGNNSVDPVIYAIHKDADLHHSTSAANTWIFGVGHKVYLSKLDVDAKHEKVFFTIVECDSSNPAKPSYYKSLVDFEFPNGYLAAAEVGQIEDVINQVLTIDNGTNEVQQPAHGGQSSSTVLTNDDIIKLVQAKLPDSVVIAKIKSSSCDFVTSTEALIKFKQAGASESVLQAILDAPPPSTPSDKVEDSTTVPTNKDARQPVCADYDSCIRSGTTLFQGGLSDQSLARFQEASQLDPSRGEAWAGIGNAYLQMGQYDDAVSMWDKALQLGSTLSTAVCHAGFACNDTGNLLLSMKEVSFVNKKGEKEFAAAPSAVTSEGAVLFNRGNAYYLQIRYGKNWRFYYTPKTVQGSLCLVCPEPGPTQQKVFADYIHGALVRMAAGDFGSQPNKP